MEALRLSVAALARLAFAEDLPDGDVTARILDLGGQTARARLICREAVIMCGAAWHDRILDAYRERVPDADLVIEPKAADGNHVAAHGVLFEWRGRAADIVAVERTFLNFLGRAIGIANATRAFVDAVSGPGAKTKILDTRKTLPGYRYFDKYAVRCGGGHNHRMSLSDQVLVKENHIAKAGGIATVMARARQRLPPGFPIQIEVESPAQLREALDAGCPLIMLDDFTVDQVADACRSTRGKAPLEVSGGITLNTVAAYAAPGPERISVGAITHSIKTPDLSLLVEEE